MVPDELVALAAEQAGVFTRAQALDAGLDAAAIERLRRRGALRVIRRHAYALPRPVLPPPGPGRAGAAAAKRAAEEAERVELALRASARLLLTDGDLVISHRWAAALHGFALVGAVPDEPELTRPPGGTGNSEGIYEAALPAPHRTVLYGLPVTSPARTLADCARTVTPEEAVVIADSALRRRVPRGDALAVLAACPRWPGVRQARQVIAFADARADSPLESRTRWRLHEQGLPPPDLQITICDPDGRDVGEVDFVWLDRRTVLEADGRLKYEDKADVWREKLREDGLRVRGFEVGRGYWPDTGPQLAAKVRGRFAMAAGRLVQPDFATRERPERVRQRAL